MNYTCTEDSPAHCEAKNNNDDEVARWSSRFHEKYVSGKIMEATRNRRQEK